MGKKKGVTWGRLVERETLERVAQIIGDGSAAHSILEKSKRMQAPIFFETPGMFHVMEKAEFDARVAEAATTPPRPRR